MGPTLDLAQPRGPITPTDVGDKPTAADDPWVEATTSEQSKGQATQAPVGAGNKPT